MNLTTSKIQGSDEANQQQIKYYNNIIDERLEIWMAEDCLKIEMNYTIRLHIMNN